MPKFLFIPLVVVTLLAAATGCATSAKEPNTVDVAKRPTMEKVIGDYEQMRTEMVDQLTAELGPKPWGDAPNDIGQTRSGCGNDVDPDGEQVSLVTQSFKGTYDRSEWQNATKIVRRVGEKYGFAETGTIVDRPDELEVYGEDEYGARYIFGMATNTVLSVSTGCHRWETPPPPAPAPSGPPNYAE